MSESTPIPCPYGSECYRKNPQHFIEYSHPQSHLQKGNGSSAVSLLKRSNNTSPTQSTASKRPRESANAREMNSTQASPVHQVALADKTARYSYYMSYVHRGIDTSFNQGSAITLHNVISGTKGTLIDSCIFSYMYDLDWIRQQYNPADRNKPLTIVEGLQGNARMDLLEQKKAHSNIKIIQAKFAIMYGVHHTKMVVLRYDTGIRIMITTANLIPLDWFQKSQALWCSPLFPLGAGDSITCFKADLMEYMAAYKSAALDEWAEVIRQYDMSKCKVFLIASVPGRHKDGQKHSFGHLKLRKVLEEHGPPPTANNWPVIGQFSSIGRLGSNSSNWLTGEFLISLSTTFGFKTRNKPQLQLIYPTTEDVRRSLEGYQAGGSLPFNQQTYNSQKYMRERLHKWRSECRGRTKASPHIKSYLRLSPELNIPWFLMTSSNLSKAAWGMLEKQDSQLMIRSYELGVLFLPKMFDLDTFVYDPTFADQKAFPVPFDLPLTPYDSQDEPWIVDRPQTTEKDSVGDYWHV